MTGRTATRAARREQRRQQRRRRWRRALLASLAGGLAVALAAGLLLAGRALLTGPRGTPTPQPSPTGRAQTTVLLSLAGTDGSAVASALLGSSPQARQGSVLLVPARLLTDVAGVGTVPFGTALALAPDGSRSRAALTDLLGVSVDAGWVLDTSGLAALVDEVGGVQVDVDVDVRGPAPGGGSQVVVPRGPQRLDGAAAAQYAAYRPTGEPEPVGLARFAQVLRAVFTALPRDRRQAAAVVDALGGGSRSTLSADRLGALLAALAVADTRYQTLPTVPVDAGGGAPAYGLDRAQSGTVVDGLFAGSLLPTRPGGPVRVLVQNGALTPGLGEQARARLVAAGFQVTVAGNAPPELQGTPSAVVVRDTTPQARVLGTEVARALGLPDSALRVAGQAQTVADVVVVLGTDFRP
ncbi:MAG: LytR C-terminal domain-containing protein [Actinomycetota bacterium]